MEEYTYSVVLNTLINMERIRAFLERTTSELFPLYFQIEIPDGYKSSEGHTLEDLSPKTTRIPQKESLKETMLILLTDVERGLSILEPLQRLEVLLTLGEQYRKNDKEIEVSDTIATYLNKMVLYINNGE